MTYGSIPLLLQTCPCVQVGWQGLFSEVLGRQTLEHVFSRSVISDSLQPHGLQHTRLPCPSLSPKLAQTHVHWVDNAIQPSHPLSSPSPPAFNFPSIRVFSNESALFTSGSQSIGASVSASVLPVNIQGWFPSGWTGLISLQSKGLSRHVPMIKYSHSCWFLVLWSKMLCIVLVWE